MWAVWCHLLQILTNDDDDDDGGGGVVVIVMIKIIAIFLTPLTSPHQTQLPFTNSQTAYCVARHTHRVR